MKKYINYLLNKRSVQRGLRAYCELEYPAHEVDFAYAKLLKKYNAGEKLEL